jgi:hypothetical protein
MKITVLPIHTFAEAGALTMREWEALGRLAVTLAPIFQHELETPNSPTSWLIHERIPAYHRWSSVIFDPHEDTGIPFIRFVFDELRKAGLKPMEWLIWFTPILPDKRIPLIPEEYSIALRLRVEKTAAKQNAVGDDPTHKPTLSEQHEKT